MKKIWKNFIIVCTVLIFALSGSGTATSSAKDVKELQYISDNKKPWVIEFNKPLKDGRLAASAIYIMGTDRTRKAVDIVISTDRKQVTVTPKTAYAKGKRYELHITNAVRSKEDEQLAQAVVLPFIYDENKADTKTAEAPYTLDIKKYDYVSHLQAKAKDNVAKIKINGKDMHYIGNNTYEFSVSNQLSELTIQAYNGQGQSLYREKIALD